MKDVPVPDPPSKHIGMPGKSSVRIYSQAEQGTGQGGRQASVHVARSRLTSLVGPSFRLPVCRWPAGGQAGLE
jgi:hypothetical protein